MSRRRTASIALLVFALLALGVPGAHASTYDTSTFYRGWKWRYSNTIGYRFVQGFPGGAYRSRVMDGSNKWNAYNGSAFQIVPVTDFDYSTYDPYSIQCVDATNGKIINKGKNGVHWLPISGSHAGRTGNCRVKIKYSDGTESKQIINSQVIFDSTTRWWTGTGSLPDGTYADLWGVATHEFGHFTGFAFGNSPPAATPGHFADSDSHTCPDFYSAPDRLDERETMCEGNLGGTRWARTPYVHDIQVFQGAY